ncbi:MAG: YeiH family protein [Stellaceae bacterium]
MAAIALRLRPFDRIMPGLLLCGLVTLAAIAMQAVEERLFGRAWLEALVLAILLGTAISTAWKPSTLWLSGISFSAKTLLEVAVVLLGASVNTRTITAVGPTLLVGIMLAVVTAITISYRVGRLLGLRQRVALLVACGNSICGNSAIAVVAPIIGADSTDVASSIAFTAVLGVIVVLALPLMVPLDRLTQTQYGVMAVLTIYAVPQVLAATVPIGVLAVRIGILVKLVRVLMLGPVVLVLSLLANRMREQTDEPASRLTIGERPARGRPPLRQLVPWFVVGFLGLAALRSAGLVPRQLLGPVATTASLLTIIAMAALGLGVNVRAVASSGARVTGAVSASLVLLGAISLGLIRALGIA